MNDENDDLENYEDLCPVNGGAKRDHLVAADLSPLSMGGTCGPTGSSVGWVVGSVSSRGFQPMFNLRSRWPRLSMKSAMYALR